MTLGKVLNQLWDYGNSGGKIALPQEVWTLKEHQVHEDLGENSASSGLRKDLERAQGVWPLNSKKRSVVLQLYFVYSVFLLPSSFLSFRTDWRCSTDAAVKAEDLDVEGGVGGSSDYVLLSLTK